MTANIAESWACACLIGYWCGDKVKFTRSREVMALLIAATIVNAATACIGAGTAAMTHVSPFRSFWLMWWLADGLGLLLITPLIVTWIRPRIYLRSLDVTRAIEAGAFLVVWCALVWFGFWRSGLPIGLLPEPYILVAMLAWPALRLGQPGVTTALFILAGMTIAGPIMIGGSLYWSGIGMIEVLLLLQLYLAIAAILGLFLAASRSETLVAEQALREDQDRMRALADNLPSSMIYQVVRDGDGSMRGLYVSAAAERLNGITPEEALRDLSNFHNQVEEADRVKLAAAIEVSAREMSIFNVVVRSRRKDGQRRWMSLSSMPRRLADGRIIWDGVQTDITEQKGTEEQLESFFSLIPDMVCLTSRDGCFKKINLA
jgi:PAS domain S-box-containing protein